MILDGQIPYTSAYNMKFPGTYYMYALIMALFGKTITGVHLGLTFIVIGSMFLLFYITKLFVSQIGAVISAFTFGILGTSWTMLAQAAHATHFVTFYALLGIATMLSIYKNDKKNLLRYFIGGLFLSLAFICKQSGIFFIFVGFTIIIINEFKTESKRLLIKRILVYSLGLLFPLLIMLSYFYFFGDFDKFWFWTVEYLQEYSTQVPLSKGYESFTHSIQRITDNHTANGYSAIWTIALIGIPLIFFSNNSKKNKVIITSILLCSFLSITPGLYFRYHYFITLLPAVGLLTALFFKFFNNFFIRHLKQPNLLAISLIIFIVLISSGLKANWNYLFKTDTKILCKEIYGDNPFVESIDIANYIKKNTSSTDKIAILGSEPQIYFYADRNPGTGYIYTYNLLEEHAYSLKMQKEMIQEIEICQPKYLILVNISLSWLPKPNSNKYIFNWAQRYIDNKYTLVALSEVNHDWVSHLINENEVDNYIPRTHNLIYIFKKTSN